MKIKWPIPNKKIFLTSIVILFISVLLSIAYLFFASAPININSFNGIIKNSIQSKLKENEIEFQNTNIYLNKKKFGPSICFEKLNIKDKKGRFVFKSNEVCSNISFKALLRNKIVITRLFVDKIIIVHSISKQGKVEIGYDAEGEADFHLNLIALFQSLTRSKNVNDDASLFDRLYINDATVVFINKSVNQFVKINIDKFFYSKESHGVISHGNMSLGEKNNNTINLAYQGNFKKLEKFALNIDDLDLNLIPLSPFKNIILSSNRLTVSSYYDDNLGKHKIILSRNKNKEHALDSMKSNFALEYLNIYAENNSFRNFTIKELGIKSNNLEMTAIGSFLFADTQNNRLNLSSDIFKFRIAPDKPLKKFNNLEFDALLFKNGNIKSDIKAQVNDGEIELSLEALKKSIDYEIKIIASSNSTVKKQDVFTFWPIIPEFKLRDYLMERIIDGNFSNLVFSFNASLGELLKPKPEYSLNLNFDIADGVYKVMDELPTLTCIGARANLTENSFSLNAHKACMNKSMSKSTNLKIENFKNQPHVIININAQNDVGLILEDLDRLVNNQFSKIGLNSKRISGQATADLYLNIPIEEKSQDQLIIRFNGKVQKAMYKSIALGWDLEPTDLVITADNIKDTIIIKGNGIVGPFEGNISYLTGFTGGQSNIELIGQFNGAPYGGSPVKKIAMESNIVLQHKSAKGSIKSDIFEGSMLWNENIDSHDIENFQLNGTILSKGMVEQGYPIFHQFDNIENSEIKLKQTKNIWNGVINADALSGQVSFVDGEEQRLVYLTNLDKQKASILGLPKLSIFNDPKLLSVNISLNKDVPEAIIQFDKINAILGWSDLEENKTVKRTLAMNISHEYLHDLGLPKNLFNTKNDLMINSEWQNGDDQILGQISLNDNQFLFKIPFDSNINFELTGDVSAGFLKNLGFIDDYFKFDGTSSLKFQSYKKDENNSNRSNIEINATGLDIRLDKKILKKNLEPFLINIEVTNYNDHMDYNYINIDGENINIKGRAQIDNKGKFNFIDFSDIKYTDLVDSKFKYYQLEKGAITYFGGDYLDLNFLKLISKPFIKPTMMDNKSIGRINVDFKNVFLHNKSNLVSDFKVELNYNFEDYALNATAHTEKNNHTIKINQKADYKEIVLSSDNIGNLIYFYTNKNQYSGGILKGDGIIDDNGTHLDLRIKNLKVKQVPLIAQLLSVASLEGLSRTLTGEGIMFKKVQTKLLFNKDELNIIKGSASGDELGLVYSGKIKNGEIDLKGSLVPFYSINSIFGSVSDNKTGLVGVEFDVKGNLSKPEVNADPFSLFIPNFLKKSSKTSIDKQSKD